MVNIPKMTTVKTKGLLLLLLLNVLAISHAVNVDVCLLGLGGGGANLIADLKDRGYSVMGYETEDYIGGQCNTIRFMTPNGTESWTEAGVTIFLDTVKAKSYGFGNWQIDTLNRIKRFAGPDSIVTSPYANIVPYKANFATRKNFGLSPPNIPPEFYADFQRFMGMAATMWSWAETFVDPSNPMPDPLPDYMRMPFDEWLTENNLTSLSFYFNFTLWGGGYGRLSKLDTLTAILQSGTLSNLLYQIDPSSWFSIKNGCKSYYDGIKNYIGTNSYKLKTKVTKATRLPDKVIIYGLRNGVPFTDTCRKLIVTIPPTLNNLQFLDPSPEEIQLFKNVKTVDTVVAHVNLEGPLANSQNKFSISNINPNKPNTQVNDPNLLSVTRYHNLPGPGVALAFSHEMLPLFGMKAIMELVSKGIPKELLTDVDFVKYWEHEYAPRFSMEDLAQSPPLFIQLDNLQNHLNTTFYATPLRVTSTSSHLWNSNLVTILDPFFPPLNVAAARMVQESNRNIREVKTMKNIELYKNIDTNTEPFFSGVHSAN